MKIFTYLRTIWHEFWMYMLVGPTTQETEEILASKKEPLKTNAALVWRSEVARFIGKAMTEGTNRQLQKRLDLDVPMPVPTKKLWVYNASRLDHIVDHPQLGNVKIPANRTKKRYTLWTSFPDVIIGVQGNVDYAAIVPQRGVLFVEDVIKGGGMAGNRDLSVKGVFWSYNNPPTTKEVNVAVKAMRSHYADLMEQATILYESSSLNERSVREFMADTKCSLDEAIKAIRVRNMTKDMTPEHHAAAEYFKVTTPWHPVLRS